MTASSRWRSAVMRLLRWPWRRTEPALRAPASTLRVALMLLMLIGLPTTLLVSADLRELARDRATVRNSLREAHRTQAAALAADIAAQLRRRLARLHLPDDNQDASRMAGNLEADRPFIKEAFWIDRDARLNGRQALPPPATIADLPEPVGGGDPLAAASALRGAQQAEMARHDLRAAARLYRQVLLLSAQRGVRAHAAFALGRVAEEAHKPLEAAQYYRATEKLLGNDRDEDGVPYGLIAALRLAAIAPYPEFISELRNRLATSLSSDEDAVYQTYLARAVAAASPSLDSPSLAAASPSLDSPSLAGTASASVASSSVLPWAAEIENNLWPRLRNRDLSEPRWIRLDGPKGPELFGVAGTPKGGYVGFEVDLQAIADDYVPRWARRVSLDPTSEASFRVTAGRAPNSVEVRLEPPFDFARAAIRLRENLVERRLHAQAQRSLAALGLILLVVSAGTWALYRGITRELGFARMQAAFVAGVSHELKTPLTAIKMYAELLALGLAKEPAAAAKTLVAEGDRLARLIDRVLDFARIQRGAKTYNPVRVDALAAIHETLAILEPNISENGFSVEVDAPANLPFIKADRDAFLQVMLNLVGNALKYSGEAREIRIRVSEDAADLPAVAGRPAPPPALRIDVEDHGIGIPKREHVRIFRPFHRVGPADGPAGSGLGLALVKDYVTAHGGEIFLASEPGIGSTFTILWPRYGSEQTSAATEI